jgi:hypothetical protein
MLKSDDVKIAVLHPAQSANWRSGACSPMKG